MWKLKKNWLGFLAVLALLCWLPWGLFSEEKLPEEMTDQEIIQELINNLNQRETAIKQKELILNQREADLKARETELEQREERLQRRNESINEIETYWMNLIKDMEKIKKLEYWKGFFQGSSIGLSLGVAGGLYGGLSIGVRIPLD